MWCDGIPSFTNNVAALHVVQKGALVIDCEHWVIPSPL